MTKTPKNVGASVRDRLLNLARERKEDFQLLLTRYANERLLYRLASSAYGDRFVLKGAALFMLWTGEPHRATRDVDLLGFGEPSVERIRAIFAEVITRDVEGDGVRFDVQSLEAGPIREDQEYGGVRVTLTAHVATAKVKLQVDIGFGDAITPEAVVVEYPTLLEFPAPKLRAYPRETVVAEKLEAMVKLGLANSRMKDFYDLLVLSKTFEFDGALLVRAIRATFARRGTPLLTSLPTALTSEFADDGVKNTQWKAFVRKSGVVGVGDLSDVVGAVRRFLGEALASTGAFNKRWTPGGPWV